jgi:5-formyltetrahydrofolate cyclo-ligase
MDERGDSRWAGRNSAMAAIRERVWSGLAEAQVNVGPVFDRIPNFVGADVAAKRLSELVERRRGRIVKCNPDAPQIPIRPHALYDGKLLFSPVPYLSKGFPYLRIDPDKFAAKGVDFETAAIRPDQFADIPFLSALRDLIERWKRPR